MKKILLLLMTVSSLSILAQKKETAVFPDGSTVEYEMVSTNASDIQRLSVWIFDFNSRSTFSVGTSVAYSMPDLFLTKAHIGLSGNGGIGRASIENTIFFKTMEKPKRYNVTLKSETSGDVVTKYVVKKELTTRRQLGARIGYLHGDYRNDLYQTIPARANEVSVGFSYVNTKFYMLKMARGRKDRTYSKFSRTSYYVEFINYHAVKDLSNPDDLYDSNSFKTNGTSGYRIGLDGQVGGKFGLSYTFGFEKPLKDKPFDVFLGFGMFLNFI